MLQEKRQHSSELVPFTYYECVIPEYFACVPLHWHREIEINYILSGSAEFLCGDERFISHEGDLIILPPNMLHAIYPNGDAIQRYDTLVFSADILSAASNDRCTMEYIKPLLNGQMKIQAPITNSHPDYPELKRTVESIFACAKGNRPELDMLLKSEMLRLFWLLTRSGDIRRQEAVKADSNDLLRPAIEYINQNFCEPITIQQLADTVHLSRSYFMGQFKQAAGMGAIEYINQLRIKKACRLLSDTDTGIAEIAFSCGYRNLSNFNRQFRQMVNCTPGAYRHILRQAR